MGRIAGLAVALIAALVPVSTRADDARAVAVGIELGTSMQRLVGSLEAAQLDEAFHAFDDEERFDLRLAPFGLEGLPLRDMSASQRKGLGEALAVVLSPRGVQKIETIRSLEREVGLMEAGIGRLLMGRRRDPALYYLSIFGRPEPGQPWGMRFDGHHLSLNWTAVPGRVPSVTPLFLGGQPRVVPEDLERAGLRVMRDEEELALALARSLSAGQRERAEIELESGLFMSRPMFVGAAAQLDLAAPAGLPRSAMTPPQRAALRELVEVYLAHFVPAIADHHRARIANDADRVHFLFAGSLVPGEPSYYRIRGPSFLIEFDNTDEDADHIHIVWRDLDGDFGRDVLREHHRAHH